MKTKGKKTKKTSKTKPALVRAAGFCPACGSNPKDPHGPGCSARPPLVEFLTRDLEGAHRPPFAEFALTLTNVGDGPRVRLCLSMREALAPVPAAAPVFVDMQIEDQERAATWFSAILRRLADQVEFGPEAADGLARI